MREPVYLKIASNKVIDISEYIEIAWGIDLDGQYKVFCKSRTDHTWYRFTFEDENCAIRFANHFYGGPCEAATLSVRRTLQ